MTFPIALSPPFPPWRGLIFEEDEALRIAITSLNLSVFENSGTPRAVEFLWENPQREMDPQFRPATQGNRQSVAEVPYPNVKVGFLYMERDPEREQRNFNQLTIYEPNSGNLLGGDVPATIDMPIPLYLHYQITANATNLQHVRQLINALTYTILLPRFGGLMCPSGTVRRLDIVSGPRNVQQTDHNQKRFFRAVWNIRISSEIEYGSVAGTPVEEVLLSVTNTNTYQFEDLTVTA